MATLIRLATDNLSSMCTITDPTNAYNDTTNSTYASLSYSSTSGFARFSGFNFSSIPAGSTINSVTYKVKARSSSAVTQRYVKCVARINNAVRAEGVKQGTTAEVITLTNSSTPTLSQLKSDPAYNYIDCKTGTDTGGTREVYGIEIIVDYTPPTFEISASAGSNGSINPSGAVNVASGDDQIFTITPDTGYELDTLTVDGSPASPTTLTPTITYKFTNVTATHSISVTFKSSYNRRASFFAEINRQLFGGV